MDVLREYSPSAELLSFALECASVRKTCSYPLLSGAELEAEIALRAKEGGLLRIAEADGRTRGALAFFSMTEDGYAQTTGIFVREGDVPSARALIEGFAALCPGCELTVGLAGENETVSAALEELGFAICERCSHLESRGGTCAAASAERIGRERLGEYLKFHEEHFSDCYWNAARLEACFENWRVYAAGRPVHSGLFLRKYEGGAEIFGLAARDVPSARDLISTALAALKGGKVTYLSDAGSAGEAAALDAGFERLGEYVCWRREDV